MRKARLLVAAGTDSVTLSSYLGFESLRPALDLADENDRGIFCAGADLEP